MARRTDDAPRETQVVVIGSGPCGAMAAHRLVRAGLDVTMLDAGGRAPLGIIVKAAGRTAFRWVDRRYLAHNRHAAAVDPNTEWYSSLSLGGLSNYWTGAVPRFAPADFTDGERLGEHLAWPVTYDDVAPYYDAVEEVVAITAGEPIAGVPPGRVAYTWRLPRDWAELTSAASAQGFPMGAIPLAKGRPWMVALRGNEFDSYHALVRPDRARGLRLLAGAHALRIVHDDGTARAIEYLDRESATVRTLRALAVVVAAGTLDTTEILLRSTSPSLPGGLGSSDGVLGRYLHDHPREWYPVRLHRPMTALAHPVYLARSAPADSLPLMAASSTIGLTSNRDRLRTLHNGAVSVIGVQAFGTMIPSEAGRVSLVGSTDPLDASSRLLIDLRYGPDAVNNIEEARARLLDALARGGTTGVAGPFHEMRPGSSVHFAGSARMHRDRRHGVVDEWNRVFDAPNVVVCDASCFTTGPEKNPTLTAMALAARAADHLAAMLGASG